MGKVHTHKIGYNNKSTLNNRACGFGIGERFGTPPERKNKKAVEKS